MPQWRRSALSSSEVSQQRAKIGLDGVDSGIELEPEIGCQQATAFERPDTALERDQPTQRYTERPDGRVSAS
jgi:hypothetical protein